MGAGVPDDEAFESSRMRALIEGSYPAPIARAFARLAAGVEGDESAALVDVAGIAIRYPALVALRDLLARPDEWLPETPTVLAALKRPLTDGKWLEMLRHGVAVVAAGSDAGGTDGRTLIGDFGQLLAGGLDGRLGEVISLRNKIVHEGRRDLMPAAKRALGGALASLATLRFQRVLVPRAVEGREGDAARYRATLYRGHAPPYPTVTVETEVALEPGRPYLSRVGRPEVLALYPCVVEAPCAACGGDRELFLLSHREKGAIRAVAPVTGHALDEAEARAAGQVLAQLLDRLEKRTGRFVARRFDVGGESLVARRRLAGGEVVGGRYRVEGFIASGGMADVYAARDEAAGGRRVALKMLPIEIARSEETLRRFLAEVRQARQVDHRNVVRYVDHGEDRGDHYLVLELAEGWPLDVAGVPRGAARARDAARLLRAVREAGGPGRRGGLPEAVVHALALDVADGLQAIHELGVVHRDLKPANILLFEEGGAGGRRIAKVADFGVSWDRRAETMTLTGFAVGTPEYMAPEQAVGRARGAHVGHEVDVYALGVILYELLAGDVPFRGETPLETAHLHATRKPEWLRRRAPEVSEGLAQVVMKCLRKDPKARYRSAADLYRDLRRLEEKPDANPVGEAEPETAGLGPAFRLGTFRLGAAVTQATQPRPGGAAEAGGGGFGGEAELVSLYEAVDERTGEDVQVGVFSARLESDPADRKRALERLAIARRLKHPALIHVREVDEAQGYTYFVADRPSGVPLEQLGKIATDRALRLGLDLAAVLLLAERAGLRHGRAVPEAVTVASDAGTAAGGAANPFLEASIGRVQLGLPALVPGERAGAQGPSDVAGVAGIVWRLATGAEPVPGAALPGELGVLVERALRGGYAGAEPFGRDLARLLRLGRAGRALKWHARRVIGGVRRHARTLLTIAATVIAIQAAAFGHRFATRWVAPGHAPFGGDCGRCHTGSLWAVEDTGCLACHDGLLTPAQVGELETAAAGAGRRFATHARRDAGGSTVQAYTPMCAECHDEHGGADRLAIADADDRTCTGCHADLDAHASGAFGVVSAGGKRIAGFGDGEHPEFAPIPSASFAAASRSSGRLAPDGADRARIFLDHARHLNPESFLPRHWKDRVGRSAIVCADCHVPDESRRHMEPIRYERHCQECHPLVLSVRPLWYEGPGGTFRFDRGDAEVPHGLQPDLVRLFVRTYADRYRTDLQAALEEFIGRKEVAEKELQGEGEDDGGAAAPPPGGRPRPPGPTGPPGGGRPPAAAKPKTAKEWIDKRLAVFRRSLAEVEAKKLESQVFSAPNTGCVRCHLTLFEDAPPVAPERPADRELAAAKRYASIKRWDDELAKDDGGKLPVIPRPEIPARWLRHSIFDHATHRILSCAECHEGALRSRQTYDVLLPGVAVCRTCHFPGGARARCVDCHLYHDRDHQRDFDGRKSIADLAGGAGKR